MATLLIFPRTEKPRSAPRGTRRARAGQGSSFLTALSYLRSTWRLFGRLDLAAAYVHASVGSLVRSRGGADADYGFVQASLKL